MKETSEVAALGSILTEIEHVLIKFTGAPPDIVRSSITAPPGNSHAIYGTSIALRLRPDGGTEDLARQIARHFNSETASQLTVASAIGPYVNFTASLGAVDALSRDLMRGERRAQGRILIEAHPPNIDSDFYVLHYRALATSNYLYKLFSGQGFETHQLIFWNDCGLPAGRAILSRRQGSEIDYDPKAVLSPVDDSEASALAASIEAGDQSVVDEWKSLRSEVLRRYLSQMRSFNFFYDRLISESDQFQNLSELRTALLARGLATVSSDGSIISSSSRSEDDETILFRRDGTSLYLTRDLAELLTRAEMPVARNIYVVARNQAGHFRKLFELAEGLGSPLAELSEYASFGLSHPRGVTVLEALEAITPLSPSWLSADPENPRIPAELALRIHVLLTKRTSDLMATDEVALKRALGQYLGMLRACERSALSQNRETRRASRTAKTLTDLNDARLIRQIDGVDRAKITAGTRLDPSLYLKYAFELARSLEAATRTGSAFADGLEAPAVSIVREALSFMDVEVKLGNSREVEI